VEAKIEKNKLKDVLSRVGGAINKSSTLPVLECVKLEFENDKLSAYSSDLDMWAFAKCKAETKERVVAVANATVLMNVVSELASDKNIDEMLTISVNEGVMGLTVGKFKASMPLIDEKEYPEAKNLLSNEGFEEISRKEIQATIKKISIATAKGNDSALAGIAFEKQSEHIRVVATDGHILLLNRIHRPEGVKVEVKGDAVENTIVIPVAAKKIVDKMEGDVLRMFRGKGEESSMFGVYAQNVGMTCRSIDTQYPPIDSVIPEEKAFTMSVEVDRKEVLDTVHRAMVLSGDNFLMRFKIKNGKCSVSSKSAAGEADVSFEYKSNDSGEILIGFNGKLVTNVLSFIDTDKVIWKFTNPTAASMISPVPENGRIALIMPVQLTD
jgi:DNA polymerase-3 subunit beta